MSLNERRAAILKLIIADFVQTAQPVGSDALVSRHHLELSSATIRNEMARLEEEGYVTHPHTSAGRVPSDRGYRYFVESLMGDPDLPPAEKLRILHQFHQATSQISEWLELAATVLSQAVRNVAVVTAPRVETVHLKHLELVSLHETTALLVLVTEDVKVRQHVLSFTEPVAQDDLSRIAGRLNHQWAGLSAEQVQARLDELSPRERVVGQAVLDILMEEERVAYSDARIEGLRNVLEQPEFSQATRALEVIEALDEHNLGRTIPPERTPDAGVTVIIGGEHPDETMRELSVVITSYGTPAGPKGSLAVVGPTRMHYPRAIATVRYMGTVMSELLMRLYAR